MDAGFSDPLDSGELVDPTVSMKQDSSSGETPLTLPDATEPQTTTETQGPMADAPTQTDAGDTESPETPETDGTCFEESSRTVQRSTRNRHPPERFDEQSY